MWAYGRAGTVARLGGLFTMVFLAVTPGSGRAQEWRFEALSGRYRHEQSVVGASSTSALLGIRYVHGTSGFGLVGGFPLTDNDTQWGTAFGVLDLTTGEHPFRLGLRLSGQAFTQGDRGDREGLALPGADGPGFPPLGRRGPLDGGVEPTLSGWGVSGEVTPVLAYRRSGFVVEGRAGVATFHSDFSDQVFDRALRVARIRVSRAVGSYAVLTGEANSLWADEGNYPYVGANVLLIHSPFTVRGTMGRWLAEGMEAVPWSLGVSLQVSDRLSVLGAARRDEFDPLFQTPGRTSWSVGVSLSVGRRLMRPAAPVPSRYEGGVAEIRLRAEQADGGVSVAGDFNDWKPEPMALRGDEWIIEVSLPPGVYYYSFVRPDGTWFVPETVPGRKPDGFGGDVAVLIIE